MELLGLLLPVLIDIFNRRIPDEDLRLLVSVIFCSIVGSFVNWLNTAFIFATPLDAFQSVSSSIMVVFGLSQLSFNAVWKKAPIREDLGLKAPTENKPDDPNTGSPDV